MKAFMRRLIARRLEDQVRRLVAIKHPIIVAVTGSFGKTSTKLAVASVLGAKYQVLAHAGNFNTEISLPLSIFELEPPRPLANVAAWLKIFYQIKRRLAKYPYDALVLELAADHPGEIPHFMTYLQPDIGIVTAIAPVHLEGFGTIEAVAAEKWSLARGSHKVLANAEDNRLAELVKTHADARTYGLGEGNYYFKTLILDEAKGYKGLLNLDGLEVKIETSIIAKHSLYALVAAAAVGHMLAVPAEDIKARLETWHPAPGRMNLLPGKNGSLVIDDTYNSSPDATIAALETLRQFHGRKIAVLGNMNELGDYAEQGHRRAGAAAKDVDLLVTIGHMAEDWLAPQAANAGLAPDRIKSFASPYLAGEFLAGELKPGDTVLAKGSQNGVFAEEVVALILASPDDRTKLVRQSPEWQKRKKRQFKLK